MIEFITLLRDPVEQKLSHIYDRLLPLLVPYGRRWRKNDAKR